MSRRTHTDCELCVSWLRSSSVRRLRDPLDGLSGVARYLARGIGS